MAQRSTRRALSWYLQRITGVFLLIFALGHYFMVHWTESSGHTFDATVARLQNPIYVFLYLGFVLLGFYHGLQGIWNIIRDFKLPKAVYTLSAIVLFLLGAYFVYLGFDTVLSIDSWMNKP